MRRLKPRVFGVLVVSVAATTLLLLMFGSSLRLPPSPSNMNFLKVPLRALTDLNQQQQQQQQLQQLQQQQQRQLQQQQQQAITFSSSTIVQGNCSSGARWVEGLPPLYIITPTYPRAEQIPEITRTAQTLLNVANVIWLVSEDAPEPTAALTSYLSDSPLNAVYLRAQMPAKYMKAKNKPRGVANRLAGLNWVRANAKTGVLYFADDDNTYDMRIFDQMRWTKRVSMFPVGLVTKLGVSTPIVRQGKVVGFYDGWIANRKFPVDMAGFAVSVPFLLAHPNATMPFTVGYEEDGFLKSLGITSDEIEPLAFNCTKIWVWHTQTKKNVAAVPVAQNNITMGTNLDVIKGQLWKDPKAAATAGTTTKDKKAKVKKKKS